MELPLRSFDLAEQLQMGSFAKHDCIHIVESLSQKRPESDYGYGCNFCPLAFRSSLARRLNSLRASGTVVLI